MITEWQDLDSYKQLKWKIYPLSLPASPHCVKWWKWRDIVIDSIRERSFILLNNGNETLRWSLPLPPIPIQQWKNEKRVLILVRIYDQHKCEGSRMGSFINCFMLSKIVVCSFENI